MSSVISYLHNLQIRGRSNESLPPKARLNFDDRLLRLDNRFRDQLHTYHQEQEGSPAACRFRKDAELDILAVANENGEIMIVDSEKSKILSSFYAHNNAVYDISWLPYQNSLMTASGDSTAKLFDMTTCECVSTFPSPTSSIRTIDVCPVDSNIFATGTVDGCISLWDRRDTCRKPYSTITDAHPRNFHRSRKFPKWAFIGVSRITFQDSNHLVSAGIADRAIKVWDLRRTYVSNHEYSPWKTMEYSTKRKSDVGCLSLKFDSTRTRLYAGLASNSIRRFDFLSYTEDGVFSWDIDKRIVMNSENLFVDSMDLSYDDQYLLWGSHSRANIWNTNKPGPPLLVLPGYVYEDIGCVAWCPYSNTKLVTASDEGKLRIWRTKISEHRKRGEKRWYYLEPRATTEGLYKKVMVVRERFCQLEFPVSGLRQPSPQTPVSTTSYYSPVTPRPCSPSSLESAQASSPSTERCLPNGSTPSTESGVKENSSSPVGRGEASTERVKRTPIHFMFNPEGCARVNVCVRCCPDSFINKCQKFLSSLAGGETSKTASNAKKIVQNLIDGTIEPEEFSTQLEKEIQFSHQPLLVHFLKKSVPLVRQALINGETAIEGIRPPPMPVQAPASQVQRAEMEEMRQEEANATGPRKKLKLNLSMSASSQEKKDHMTYTPR